VSLLEKFETSKSIKVEGGNIFFQNASVIELMANASFSQAIFLSLTQKMPDAKTTQMIDSVLTALMPETAASPSSLCAKISASTGAKLNSAVSAGVAAMDERHGLHLKECMDILKDSIRDMQEIGLDVGEQAEIAVQQSQVRGSVIPGYGTHNSGVDIRVERLDARAKELGFEGNFVKLAKAISPAYKTIFSLDMPLNIEGIAAAILLEIGIAPEKGPAFFMIAKLPFLFAGISEVKGWDGNGTETAKK
jgi:citrate synthase